LITSDVWVTAVSVCLSAFFLVTGDTITNVARIAWANVTSGDLVGTSGIVVTVVVLLLLALIAILASLWSPVIPGVSVLAVTLSIPADRASWAVHCTLLTNAAVDTVTNVRGIANALLDWSARVTGHANALGIGVAVGAWVRGTTLVHTVALESILAHTFEAHWVSGAIGNTLGITVTVVVLTWAQWAAVLAIASVSVGALANGVLVAVLGGGDSTLGTLVTLNTVTWWDVNLAVETVTGIAFATFALVVVLVGDNGVGDAVGIVTTVVVGAWVDLFTDLAITVPAGLALACVVDFVADEARCAHGMLVATAIVGLAWIVWQTLGTGVTSLAFASVTDTVLAGNAVGILVADVVAWAVVNDLASLVTIADVVLVADAVVSLGLVDTGGILVAFVVAGLALIDGADKSIIVSCKPMLPFGIVLSWALSENVGDEGLDLGVQVGSGLNVVEVDQVAWDGTGLGITVRAVSFSTRSGIVSHGFVVLFVIEFSQVEQLVQEESELGVGVLLVADLGTGSEQSRADWLPADLAVLEWAETRVGRAIISSITSGTAVVTTVWWGPWADEWWKALLSVAAVTLFALASVAGVCIGTGGELVAQVSTVSTLVSWSGAVATVTSVALLDLARAHVTVLQVSAISVLVAIVRLELTLVDGHLTLVTVANVTLLALAVVASWLVNTVGVFVATMFVELTLVDLWVATDAVSIVALLADAVVAWGLLAVDGILWHALGVLVAVVFVIGAVVWLVAWVLSQLLEVETEFVLPALVAFFLDFGDNGLEWVSPVTGSLILGVVNESTANVTGVIVAHDGTIAHGLLAQLGQLGGDGLPGGNGLLDAVGGFEGNLLKLFVGEGAVLVQVTHASVQVVGVDAVGSVAVNIRVALVTGTLEAGKGILTRGILVAVVLASDALVDLWLATVLAVLVVSLFAVANTVTAFHVLAALDTVAFVLVLAVKDTSTAVSSYRSVVVVLAHTLVTLAFLNTSRVFAAWVWVALFLIAAHLTAAIVTLVTLALETGALVDACGVGVAVVCFLGALIFVAVFDTLAVLHRVSLDAFALVSTALVVTGGILAAITVVLGALVLVAAVGTAVTGLALAFVADAFVNADSITLAAVVAIALVLIAALVTVAGIAVLALAFVTFALVNTLGIGVAWVLVALVLVALGDALAILEFEAVFTGTGVANALVNAFGIGTATAVVAIVTLIGIATFVSVTAVTFSTRACVWLACVGTDGIVTAWVLVALIGTAWIWRHWIGVALARILELSQQQVPLSADGAGTTATVGTLSVNDGLDLVDDWLVCVVGEVHQVTSDRGGAVTLALVSVTIPVTIEFVHWLGQLGEDGVGVVIVGVLSIEGGIGAFDALEWALASAATGHGETG
jgi:hypothetical protein